MITMKTVKLATAMGTNFFQHNALLICNQTAAVVKKIYGQKFEKVENGENRFFAITSSKLVRNWFCKKHLVRNHIFHNFCLNYGL